MSAYDALGIAAQANACAQAVRAQFDVPTQTIPAGITWEHVSGREQRVTIRREPEAVYDWRALQNAAMGAGRKPEAVWETYAGSVPFKHHEVLADLISQNNAAIGIGLGPFVFVAGGDPNSVLGFRLW